VQTRRSGCARPGGEVVDGARISPNCSPLTCGYSLHRMCVEEKTSGCEVSQRARVIHTSVAQCCFPGQVNNVTQIPPGRPSQTGGGRAIAMSFKTPRGVSLSR
jgi:hypothetical protein